MILSTFPFSLQHARHALTAWVYYQQPNQTFGLAVKLLKCPWGWALTSTDSQHPYQIRQAPYVCASTSMPCNRKGHCKNVQHQLNRIEELIHSVLQKQHSFVPRSHHHRSSIIWHIVSINYFIHRKSGNICHYICRPKVGNHNMKIHVVYPTNTSDKASTFRQKWLPRTAADMCSGCFTCRSLL